MLQYVMMAMQKTPPKTMTLAMDGAVGNQQKCPTFVKERSGGNGSVVGLPEQVVVAFAAG